MAVLIVDTVKRSPAHKAGIKPGELLLAINGNEINDVLDYDFYGTDKNPTVQLETRTVKVKKPEYDDLGLMFSDYLMDEQKSCKNNCIFCFINQLPKNMRDTLYFKDDDARLSFLQGNYITLTNLTDKDVDRIIKMKLKINVSVHTTNPELRVQMMKNKNAGKVLDYFYKMVNANIQMNCQLVLCRGINDGKELVRSLSDLTKQYPGISSIACVPAGITKYRDGLPLITPYDKDSAGEVIDIIHGFADKMEDKYGDRVVYPADEFFKLAEREMPPYEYYGNFEQYENGVGITAYMKREFEAAIDEAVPDDIVRNVSIATGKAAYDDIKSYADKIAGRFKNTKINVYMIKNEFFGETITVAGLITGGDIIEQLSPYKGGLGGCLLIPSVMLRKDTDVFLDDITTGQVAEKLGVPVITTDGSGYDFVDKILEGGDA